MSQRTYKCCIHIEIKMAGKRLKRNLKFLGKVKNSKAALRKQLLQCSKPDQIKCLSDCCHNILKGTVKLNNQQKKKLLQQAQFIRLIASKDIKVPQKREILVQKGGFLPTLLAPIIGIAGSLIGELINNAING